MCNDNPLVARAKLRLSERNTKRKTKFFGFVFPNLSRLCITPKYLSEVTNLVSGHSANYWIQRFTSLEISRLLREKSLTPTEIADRFGFSSLSYFTRFVSRTLGFTPSELRKQ